VLSVKSCTAGVHVIIWLVKHQQKNIGKYYPVMNVINVLLNNEMRTAILYSYLHYYPMINDF